MYKFGDRWERCLLNVLGLFSENGAGHLPRLLNRSDQNLQKFKPLFDSITIEDGTLNSLCAEGASLPLRGADAEMKRPGDHYTFGPIVSGARPRKRRNESTPTCQHTGKGP